MKDPAFLFYSSDFLTGTMFMTNEQVGKYIRLLCAQHQLGSLTEEHMLNICRTYDKDIWAKFERSEDGTFYNARLKEEVDKRRNFCESRRKNRNSKQQEKHMSQHMSPHMYAHMENENENENRVVIENETRRKKPKPEITREIENPFSDSFLTIWKQWTDYKRDCLKFVYKTTESENIAIAHLAQITNGNEQLAASAIHHSIANGYKGIYLPKDQTNGKQPRFVLTDKTRDWIAGKAK